MVPAHTSSSSAVAMQPTAARCVLIVEDDNDSREMLMELVAMLGHHALGSANAGDALRVAEKSRPEVVLIDIGLPDADGCEIARSLRATPEGAAMRLVALTGYSDQARRRLAAEAGFDAFMVKPFSADRLAALLADQL